MEDERHDLREASGYVAIAAHLEPLELPERPRPARPGHREARLALAWAILGVVCLGFVFGPLALMLGRRARFAIAVDPERGGAGMAHAAIALGKLGLALHLTVAITVLPWLAMPLAWLSGE
jgi:hypothetical protein